MALYAQKGVFTAPTTGGADTVLSGLTSPKVVILWTTSQTATGAADGNANFNFGVFTYDGAAVQQWYISFLSVDAGAASDTARGQNTTACLKGFLDGTAAADYEARGVSMDATSITIDWFNAPASAIKVHYLVLGGDDLTKARAGSFGVTTASFDDITINSGFGQPDLLLFATISSTGFGDSSGTARTHLSFAMDYQTRRLSGFWEADASAAMACSEWQKARACGSLASIGSAEGESELATNRLLWPTDGFRLDHSANTYSVAHQFTYLALKGTFLKNIGVGTVPVLGTTPVVQDIDAGFPPACALFMGFALVANTAVDTTNIDLTGWFFGGTDGTNEGLSAHTQDNGNATSFTGAVHSETKTAANYIAGTLGTDPPQLQSEADGSFSGNNVRLSWNDIDTVAREYVWIALGSAPEVRPDYVGDFSLFPKAVMRGHGANV